MQMEPDVPPIPPHVIGELRGLRVRLGTFDRSFFATAEGPNRRSITIWDCRIILGGDIDGQQYEWADSVEKVPSTGAEKISLGQIDIYIRLLLAS